VLTTPRWATCAGGRALQNGGERTPATRCSRCGRRGRRARIQGRRRRLPGEAWLPSSPDAIACSPTTRRSPAAQAYVVRVEPSARRASTSARSRAARRALSPATQRAALREQHLVEAIAVAVQIGACAPRRPARAPPGRRQARRAARRQAERLGRS
jgi:hypothetical protein